MIRYAKLYADELAALLEPDERGIEAISVDYAAGRERAEGALTLDTSGGPMAGWLAKAARVSSFLVLSSRRLLVVDDLGHPELAAITWAVPLEHVSVVRHDPRLPVDVGRLLVTFSDSSHVRLRTGLLLPFAARRFARAFADLRGSGEPRRAAG